MTGREAAAACAVVLWALAWACSAACSRYLDHVAETVEPAPRQKTLSPVRRQLFELQFRGMDGCPDRIVWDWGAGEKSETQPIPVDVRRDCGALTARMWHKFERRAPRRVHATAMRGDDMLSIVCVTWPAGTPCP